MWQILSDFSNNMIIRLTINILLCFYNTIISKIKRSYDCDLFHEGRYAFKKKESRIMRHLPIHLLPPASLP